MLTLPYKLRWDIIRLETQWSGEQRNEKNDEKKLA